MKRPVVWILAAILAYLILLIAQLPAAQVVNRLPLGKGVFVSGVSGTLWSGKAEYVEAQAIGIESVEWELSALPLLWGNANVDIKAGNSLDNQQVSLQGPVSINLINQAIDTGQLVSFIPASLFLDFVPMPIQMDADGRIRVNIDSFSFNQTCQSLQGKGQWINARINSINPPLDLGNFDADLSCESNQFVVAIKEPNIFGLSAQVRIAPDMAYTVDGRFKPSAELPRAIRDAAGFFGTPDAQGYIRLEL